MYMLCLHECMYIMCVQCPGKPEVGIRSLWIGVTDSWALPLCAENWARVLWRSSQCPQTLSTSPDPMAWHFKKLDLKWLNVLVLPFPRNSCSTPNKRKPLCPKAQAPTQAYKLYLITAKIPVSIRKPAWRWEAEPGVLVQTLNSALGRQRQVNLWFQWQQGNTGSSRISRAT